MKLFDPARGDPRMLFWSGKPVGAVPQICVTPTLTNQQHLCEVCVMIAPNTARWLSCIAFDLLKLLGDFADNPEITLQDAFHWNYVPGASKSSSTRTLTLADLGEL